MLGKSVSIWDIVKGACLTVGDYPEASKTSNIKRVGEQRAGSVLLRRATSDCESFGCQISVTARVLCFKDLDTQTGPIEGMDCQCKTIYECIFCTFLVQENR